VRPFLAASEIQFADGVEPVTMRNKPAQYRNGWCIWNLAEVGSGEVIGLVEYSAGRVDPSTAEGWVADFRDLVRRIVDSPDQAWEDN
jgi:hypothetical protein